MHESKWRRQSCELDLVVRRVHQTSSPVEYLHLETVTLLRCHRVPELGNLEAEFLRVKGLRVEATTDYKIITLALIVDRLERATNLIAEPSQTGASRGNAIIVLNEEACWDLHSQVGLLLDRVVAVHSASNHKLRLHLTGELLLHFCIDRKSCRWLRNYEESIAFVYADLAELVAILVEDTHLERVGRLGSRWVREAVDDDFERVQGAQTSVLESSSHIDDAVKEHLSG